LRRWVHSQYKHHIIVPNVYLYSWESDLISVTKKDIVHEYEIKVVHSDFVNDAKKAQRHAVLKTGSSTESRIAVHRRPNYFWYVMPENCVKIEEIPMHAGFIGITFYGTEGMAFRVIKKAPQLHKEHITAEGIRRMLVSMCYKYWGIRK
jgi:hypothetical protein